MHLRGKSFISAALLVLALASCGAGDGADPTPSAPLETSTPSTTSTPSPTPTAMTTEQAGQLYLSIVEPWNAGNRTWQTTYDSGDYTALRGLATANAATLRSMTDQLVAAEWPEEVRPTVDKLIAEWSSETVIWARAGAATSDEEMFAQLDQLPAVSSSQELRVLLGLEDVPVG